MFADSIEAGTQVAGEQFFCSMAGSFEVVLEVINGTADVAGISMRPAPIYTAKEELSREFVAILNRLRPPY
jgi:molybdate-binding protein